MTSNTKIKGKLMHDGLHIVDDELNDRTGLPQGTRTVSARNAAVLAKAINEHGLTPLGKAIGHDHTYISRFRSGEQGLKIDDVLRLLDACGLRLISAGPDLVVMDRERLKAIVEIANIGMREVNSFAKYDD